MSLTDTTYKFQVGDILQWKSDGLNDPEKFKIVGAKKQNYWVVYLCDLDTDVWGQGYIEEKAELIPLQIKEQNYTIE